MKSLRLAYETKEDRQNRLQRNRQHKELRHEKLERTRHGGAHDDVEQANIFFHLGMDVFKIPAHERTTAMKKTLEGIRVDKLPKASMKWLRENYDAIEVGDPEGRLVIHFSEPKSQGDDMNLYTQLAETSGQSRKEVKAIYEALITKVKHELKHERRMRLPELGILRIRYRPAKEKRKGRNPFSGKEMWFKAKPASNKLAFRPSKDFKEYVNDKIPVEAPKKKHKKEKKHKKHHHKH
jgi:nucleoid DNA-binding protein